MDVKIKQTNTTEASATLGHADIVAMLGLAVMMQSGIPRDLPVTSVAVKLVPQGGSDEFAAEVDVVVDHNAKSDLAVAPAMPASPAATAAPATPAIASSIQIPIGLGGIPAA